MASSACIIDYEGTFRLPIPPQDVWTAIERVDRYEAWWSWLSDFSLEGGGLHTGAVLSGVVVPPLPYRMRLRIDLVECERPSQIRAAVHGDLEGRAVLRLEPDREGTTVKVAWTIEMMQRPMRLAARVAHPLLRWGHDRVVDATVNSFCRQLAAGRL